MGYGIDYEGYSKFLWPSACVYYCLEADGYTRLTLKMKNLFDKAVNEWSTRTRGVVAFTEISKYEYRDLYGDLVFAPSKRNNIVRVTKADLSTAWSSGANHVGYNPDADLTKTLHHRLAFAESARDVDYLHELGHVLGLGHEQYRSNCAEADASRNIWDKVWNLVKEHENTEHVGQGGKDSSSLRFQLSPSRAPRESGKSAARNTEMLRFEQADGQGGKDSSSLRSQLSPSRAPRESSSSSQSAKLAAKNTEQLGFEQMAAENDRKKPYYRNYGAFDNESIMLYPVGYTVKGKRSAIWDRYQETGQCDHYADKSKSTVKTRLSKGDIDTVVSMYENISNEFKD